MTRIYSNKRDGNLKLSKHFKVKEFACKDGTDELMVSEELVTILEKIRKHFSKAVIVTSGYRTPEHDKKVGGTGSGFHTKGLAADIVIRGVPPYTVALYAQSLLNDTGGVECGCYDSGGYVHVDVRSTKWRAVKAYSYKDHETISGDLFPTIKINSENQSVVLMQRILKTKGYYTGEVSGKCDCSTMSAIQCFQKSRVIKADGVCGPVTWNRLLDCR